MMLRQTRQAHQSLCIAPSRQLSRRVNSQLLPSKCRRFSVQCKVHKDTDKRFFWPSRPDFLPSKVESFNGAAGSLHWNRAQDVPQSIKRYLPLGGAKICLPPPEDIVISHAPLYTSLAMQEVEAAWSLFVSHLRDLAKNEAKPLDYRLFDALFWALASENLPSRQRHEEIFGRIEILFVYSSTQADFGMTRLQLHRSFYIWTSLWEQSDKHNLPFRQSNFLETVNGYLNEIEGRLASRIFSRMLHKCQSPTELAVVSASMQSWIEGQGYKPRRQENWTSFSEADTLNDDVYLHDKELRVLDNKTWRYLLEVCTRLGNSPETKAAGIFALQQGRVNYSSDETSRFLHYLSSAQLFNFLPTEVLEGAKAIELPLLQRRDIHIADFSTDCKDRLVYPIAFVLATRLDYRAALYLFGNDAIYRDRADIAKRTEVYTAAANACAKSILASSRTRLKHAERCLMHLQRGFRLFVESDWPESRTRNTTSILFVDALMSMLFGDRQTRALLGDDEWLLLLRQFTTVLLTNDPQLESLQVTQDSSAFSRLLRMHLHLGDYAFAKRLYLVESMQDKSEKNLTTPLMSTKDFFWLFEKSLELDPDVRFANQLFLSRTISRQAEIEPENSFILPLGLLRMYFWKLKKAAKERHGILTLQQNVIFDHIDGEKTLLIPNQATRTIRTFFGAGVEYVDIGLALAINLIDYWKKEKGGNRKMLILLYSIAMQKSTTWIEESDALLRANILKLFEDFRQFFHTKQGDQPSQSCLDDDEDTRQRVQIVYYCALKALLEEQKSSQLIQSMVEQWIEELQSSWGIQLNSRFWNRRVEACLIGEDKDVDRAKEWYEEGIRYLDDKKDNLQRDVLSASTTSKLMMAMSDRGDYNDALQLISTYQNHAAPLLPIPQAMIEGAHIAILHSQGNFQEALDRLQNLKKDSKRFNKDAVWLKTIQKASRRLSKQVKDQEEEEQRQQQDDSPFPSSDEEEMRAKIFSAMASGQPCKRKDQ